MSADDPNIVTTAVTGGVAAFGALLSYLAGQRNGKAQFITAVSAAADLVIKNLQVECARGTALHDKCETRLDGLEEENRRQRSEIEKLMHGRVAGWGEEIRE